MPTLHHERSDWKQSVIRMVKFKGHILQFVAQHIHQSPLSRCFASKTLLMQLLIYNINFKVHPICPWIQVIFFFSFTAGISEVDPGSIFTPTPPTSRPISVSSLKRTSSPLWNLTAPLLLLTSTSCRLPLCAPPVVTSLSFHPRREVDTRTIAADWRRQEIQFDEAEEGEH